MFNMETMLTKRESMETPGETVKKRRKVIDLETKMKIIEGYEAGKTVKQIAWDLNLAHSTVSTILKDKDRVKEAMKSSAGFKAIITRQRKGLIHEMEKLLAIWFDDQIQNNMPISLSMIQTKARSIFETLKAREGETSTETFMASNGWFQRFRRRFNLHNSKISCEAASTNIEAAEKFVEELDEIIKKGNYCLEQIFNVDETILWWKKMPERSCIHKGAKSVPGSTAFKDRVMLLLGGNAAGYKLKPLMIYHSENPQALKNINKNSLPVYYCANKKACLTQPLFENWFLYCFIPSVQDYCLKKGIPFKIILLIDNAPGHSQHLVDIHPDVKIKFFPKNTSDALQPMNQGVVGTFKAFYFRSVFSQAVTATENEEVTLHDFWKSYNIFDCIKNIKSAWDEVTDKCMQDIWKRCLKSITNNVESHDNIEQSDVIREIAGLASALNLDVDVEDIAELVDYSDGGLINEEIIIEVEPLQHLEEEEEETSEKVQKKFTVTGLAGVFSKFSEALLELEAMDPDVERFKKVEHGMSELLKCYREIYEEKKVTNQTTQPSFFPVVTSMTSTLETVTSESLSSPLPGSSTIR